MEIFNVQISELDAKDWLKLCKDQKIEWILKYTNQTDLEIIGAYVLSPKITKDCHCNDCGKKKKDGNISSRNAEEVEAIIEDTDASTNGRSRNKKK